jgi:hypothetical protein
VLREREALLRDGFVADLPEVAFARLPDEALRAPVFELEDLVRLALDLAPPPVARDALDFRAPPLLRDDDEPDDEPALALPSTDHLPDMTLCAASATASAIREPSLVALAITLLAACDAVSAASRPASRIARRALGLALIAAAAAASPAASISLLIAALASLSTVSLPDDEPEEPEEPDELLRADFAIASSP